eukprot:6772946-Karenia_brevis.AAC.1
MSQTHYSGAPVFFRAVDEGGSVNTFGARVISCSGDLITVALAGKSSLDKSNTNVFKSENTEVLLVIVNKKSCKKWEEGGPMLPTIPRRVLKKAPLE